MKIAQKVFLSSMLLLGAQVMFGMEGMSPIQCWKHAKLFAGKVVVYSAKDGRNGYLMFSKKNLRVGFISEEPSRWSGSGHGYQMRVLIKTGSYAGHEALTNTKLESDGLRIREVTPEERAQILTSVDEGKAELDHMIFCEEAFRKELGK